LAGLPFDMPGIGDEIDGAMQHAPHPSRQEISTFICHTLADKRVLLIDPCNTPGNIRAGLTQRPLAFTLQRMQQTLKLAGQSADQTR
jgi:hypothetical protein